MAKPKFNHWEMGVAVFWLAMWVIFATLIVRQAYWGWVMQFYVPGIFAWLLIVLIARFAFGSTNTRIVLLIVLPLMAFLWFVFLSGVLPPPPELRNP